MRDDDIAAGATGLAATETADRTVEPASAERAESYRHYRVDGMLGRGGMGEVFSAQDDQIGRTVAIKRMRSGAEDPERVARFLREARIQGQLDHPAVVPVHELGRDDRGAPVIVMKRLRGTTLAEALRTQRFTRQRLLRAFVDVCLAIELAHEQGIVHRDLKPSNIMLGDFGEVYVLDWGVARVLGEDDAAGVRLEGVESGSTVEGAILGTPGYMSPEQERGDLDVDRRTDIHALGVVLRDIVAGGDPAPELEAACVRATASDREQRHASARELAEVVERVLDGNRDLARRRQLAAQLLVEARSALASGDRREAMRAAGRALALDPEDEASAGLVAQLMLEPPMETPPEVEQELEATDQRALHAHRWIGVVSVLAFLALLPFFYWAGIRAPWFYVTITPPFLVMTAARFGIVSNGRYRPGLLLLIFVGCCLVNALGAAYVSPLLMLPISLVMVARVLLQVRLAPPVAFLSAMTATLLITSVLASRIHVAGGDLVIALSATPLDLTGVSALTFTLVLITHIALFGSVRTAVNLERAARRTVHLQAWQLRQLVR